MLKEFIGYFYYLLCLALTMFLIGVLFGWVRVSYEVTTRVLFVELAIIIFGFFKKNNDDKR